MPFWSISIFEEFPKPKKFFLSRLFKISNLNFGDSFFESFSFGCKLFISIKNEALATTGPAHEPLPTSSIPITGDLKFLSNPKKSNLFPVLPIFF